MGLVAGSGPGGRVIERDVMGYVPAPAAAPEEVAVEVEQVAVERVAEGVAAVTGGPAAVVSDVPEEKVTGEPVVAAAADAAVLVVTEEGIGTAAAVELDRDAAVLGVVEEGVGGTAADDVSDGAATAVTIAVADGMGEGTAAADADRVEEGMAGVESVSVTDAVEEGAVEVEVAAVGETAAAEAVRVEVAGVGEPVEEAAAVGETVAEPDGEAVEGRVGLSRMRQAIARVTGDSKRDAPHFYVTAEVDMGKAMSLRRDINDALPGESRVSVNDLIIRACAMGLGRHPKFNAFFRGDHLQYNAAVNIGIAITLESGLIVPGISHCESKSLVEIAAASKDLIARAQSGALRQEEYGDTTFSVSNLGMFAVDSFAAIIFPPHAAVLAVGTVREQPVVRDGQLAVGQVMKATLSTDHRVADGAEAAEFLVEVKGLLENPVKLLL